MRELIYKDDAIYIASGYCHPANVAKEIAKLPAVEPLVLTCDGCRHVGTYDTDFPCSACIRREKDYYARLD